MEKKKSTTKTTENEKLAGQVSLTDVVAEIENKKVENDVANINKITKSKQEKGLEKSAKNVEVQVENQAKKTAKPKTAKASAVSKNFESASTQTKKASAKETTQTSAARQEKLTTKNSNKNSFQTNAVELENEDNKTFSALDKVKAQIAEISEEEKIKRAKEDKKLAAKEESKKPRILSAEEVNPKLKKDKQKQKKNKKKKLSIDDAVRYKPDLKNGLDKKQIEERNENHLVNKVENRNVKTYRSIFFSNIFTFFNLVCFAVAGALIAVGAYSNLLFMAIILANITIGIVQEIKAKLTIEKISLVTAPTATVLREGSKIDISVNEVVLDDIIYFNTGKQICADCILIDGELEANESLLTGESVAVKKKKGDILYSGSFVASGNCVAIVERVGEHNYISKLASKAKEYKKPKSELLKSLNIVIRSICVVIVPIAILMYYNNFGELNNIPETIKKTAGSIIGMIPAGMFLLTSVALAAGVVKLAKRRTLVQDLYSIEMLARADVLCLDKTGTITDGTMKVNSVMQLKNVNHTVNDIMGSLLTALEDNNQTSRALATHFGYSKELTKDIVLAFSSTRKLSGVTFKNGETYAFGAPEFVLKNKDQEVEKMVKEYATKGFRVILLVKCDGKIDGDKLPLKRTPVAVIVIEDHIRQDAHETIKWFKDNAVQIKIISGDNPLTVSEVSKRVGVDRAEMFISLEGLNEQQVVEAAEKYTVFGRVSPEQKSILVKALKNKGHKVAMTGDGVNDILALKEADCSIAMASGSEATRNVSHLVLLDSNFSSMPSVVAEGRRVINNIQKSSSLFLMKTLFTILISIFCLIVRREYPFNTNQILLLEYCVIGVPSFFLALQPNKEPIRGKFLGNLVSRSLPGAIIFTLNVIACYVFDIIVGTSGQFETMASLLVTFSGLLVLFKLCKPFDVYRTVMYTGMLILCVLMLTLVPWNFYEYVKLNLQNALFILCLVQFSYPLYANIVNLCNRIKI